MTDVMETVCEKMDDYVKATYKSNGDLTLLKMVDDSGKMHPDMGIVDFIQDGDLNKSLKYYVSIQNGTTLVFSVKKHYRHFYKAGSVSL